MKKISISKIKKILINLNIKPSNYWKLNTERRLAALSENNVTVSEISRNHESSLFNFLKLFTMDAKMKLAAGVAGGIFVLGTLTTGVAYAADGSSPGDLLYPLDKALENIQRTVTTNDEEFELEILEEREAELSDLQENEADEEDIEEAKAEVEEQENKVSEDDDDEDENEDEDEDDENDNDQPSITPATQKQGQSDDDDDDDDDDEVETEEKEED